MNFALALNTIIYLLIFLFPGILFRKFYFRGDFTEQFNQGNLLERLLWTLLCSVISLFACYLIIDVIRTHFDLKFFSSISYDTLKKIFDQLSKNELPDKESFGENASEFLYLVLGIYIISATLGFVSFYLIRLINLDTKFSVFTFNNYWHYLSNASDKEVFKYRKRYVTFVDVMTNNGETQELISGALYKYHIDSTNKLQCIVLTQAYKFITLKRVDAGDILASIAQKDGDYEIHKEYVSTIVFKKIIKGSMITIFNEHILNLNFTYVRKITKKISSPVFKKVVYFIANVIYYLSLLIVVVIPWTDLVPINLSSIFQKVAFMVSAFLIFTSWIGFINQMLGVKKTKHKFDDFLFATLLFASPMLWVFDILTWYWTLLVVFVVFIIIGKYFSWKLKRDKRKANFP